MTSPTTIKRLRELADYIDRERYDECWEIKETAQGKLLRAAAARMEALENSLMLFVQAALKDDWPTGDPEYVHFCGDFSITIADLQTARDLLFRPAEAAVRSEQSQ